MKKLLIFFFLGLAVFSVAEENTEKAELSYAFGMLVAEDLMDSGLEFDYDVFVQGFREAMEKEETWFTIGEAMNKINTAFAAARTKLLERNLAEGTSFLAENGQRPEVVVTPSGLQYEVIYEGTGETPGPADAVLVHYRGATISGGVFDTTYEKDEPMEIPLDRVIPGWSEGLRMMREGGKARLYIPPELAYGENGAGNFIGPNAVLIFDVELLSIMRSQVLVDD